MTMPPETGRNQPDTWLDRVRDEAATGNASSEAILLAALLDKAEELHEVLAEFAPELRRLLGSRRAQAGAAFRSRMGTWGQ